MCGSHTESDPFAHAPVGLARLDLDGRWQRVNRQLCDMLDYRHKDLEQMKFHDVVHPEDRLTNKARLDQLIEQKSGEYSVVKRLIRRNGELVVVHLSIRLVCNEQGECDHLVLAVQNMSKTHRRLELLERRSRHDRLTNILNRAGFFEYLSKAFRTYQRHGTAFALAYIDLDGFKGINDTHGHVTGDMLLKEVATRLSNAVAGEGIAARIGGDEFAVVLNNRPSTDTILTVSHRMHDAIARPIIANDRLIKTSASIGFAQCPKDARSIRDLLQHADQEMYARKHAVCVPRNVVESGR